MGLVDHAELVLQRRYTARASQCPHRFCAGVVGLAVNAAATTGAAIMAEPLRATQAAQSLVPGYWWSNKMEQIPKNITRLLPNGDAVVIRLVPLDYDQENWGWLAKAEGYFCWGYTEDAALLNLMAVMRAQKKSAPAGNPGRKD
jgi:hypothetical protein